MESATRLPLKTIAFTTTLVLGVSASRINLRNLLIRTLSGPGSRSRIIAAVIVLLNLKNLPFAWHYRVWNAILRHCIVHKPALPARLGPSTLFLPVISSSSSPLYECDYNLHKSNSTYFSDLDVSRSHLISALLQPGIHALHNNAKYKLVLDKSGRPVKDAWSIMLGGVMCDFKREIKPYQGYEMWSRMLCWDRKWLYVVTHFVKQGAAKPRAYVLEDGRWFGKAGWKVIEGKGDIVGSWNDKTDGVIDDVDPKIVFATALSKYVVKLGRLTVHPEVLLQASNVLPPRPGGWATMTGQSGESTPERTAETVHMNGHAIASEVHMNGFASAVDAKPDVEASGEVDWKSVTARNERGLELAAHFAALDGLNAEFKGSHGGLVLGRYRDFLI